MAVNRDGNEMVKNSNTLLHLVGKSGNNNGTFGWIRMRLLSLLSFEGRKCDYKIQKKLNFNLYIQIQES